MHLSIHVLSNTIPSYMTVVHSSPGVDRSCFHAACLEHGFFDSRITQHIVTIQYTHTDLLLVNISCNSLKCFLKKKQRPFPSILEKYDELLKLNISTYMLLTPSRSWNIEFEKRNDFISILQEKLFNQSFVLLRTTCMEKQFDA